MSNSVSPQQASTGTTTRAIKELLPLVGKGDQAALNELVTITHERLLRLIRGKRNSFAGERADRYVRGDEQTGAILSDLYVRLLTAMRNDRLNDLRHPAGFWKIAASNVMYILLDMARSRRRDLDRLRDSTAADDGGRKSEDERREDGRSPANANHGVAREMNELSERSHHNFENAMLRLEVLDAVERLPEPHQTVVELHYYLGLTYAEIAAILVVNEPRMHERRVGRIIDQAEEMLRPHLES